MGALKPIGRATAISRGHYPLADGRHKVMLAGESFTVWQGLDKASWFKLAAPGQQEAKVDLPPPADPPAPPEPTTLAEAAKVERKRKAEVKPPMGGDDIV